MLENASTEAIASAFNPVLSKHHERTNLLCTVQFQELKTDIAELRTLMTSIDTSLANRKKPITKKTADVTDGAIADITAGVANLAVTATPKPKVNIPKYFGEQFKKEEFKARVQSEELKKALEVHPMVISKPTAAQKATLITKLTLEDIKINNKALYAEIEAEATAAANRDAAAVVNPEQVAEEHTPKKK